MSPHKPRTTIQASAASQQRAPIHRLFPMLPAACCPPPAAPHGISLMEVLVSIGIVAIGLVSVLSLLPVGGYQAAEANKNERKATLGLNAVQDLKNRGVLDPNNWITYNQTSGQWVRLKALPYATAPTMYNHLDFLPPLVIDPQMASYAASAADYPTISRFPANGLVPVPSGRPPDFPFRIMSPQSQSGPQFYRWLGMTRCTLAQACTVSGTTITPSRALADAICMSADDTFATRPEDGSMPAVSPYTSDSTSGAILKRDFEGAYSWIITLTPTELEIDHIPPTEKRQYLMSLVVFNRRLPSVPASGTGQEEVVYARHALGNSGIGGGDFDLGDSSANAESKLVLARPGNWLMLYRYEPTGNPAVPVWPVFNWYRIVSATESGMGQIQIPDITGSMTNMLGRSVTLAGPDWQRVNTWTPAGSLTWPSQVPSQYRYYDTYACLFDNIVAVYQRPIYLEGPSPWSQ